MKVHSSVQQVLDFIAAVALVFVWVLIMSLTAAGYLLKMGVDAILTELVTFYANLGKKIGMQ